uniref:G-protein coupled receptors family 1 profile domain-containing protein n=1 Tax=Anopheles stephensi TaxID=30069 RepID=A0A182Y4Z7_ANOST
MTEGPFVYGIELRDPPTAPTDISQYDLLFGPGSLLHQHHHQQHQPNRYSMAEDGDQYQYGTNLSLALGDVLLENISAAIAGTHNLSGDFGSTAISLPPGTGHHGGGHRGGDSSFQNQLIIPLYAIIFLLSVVGNLLVILTLAQNKRMRTVTNVYLLNLVGVDERRAVRDLNIQRAISDLLLGVFCMPFTLAGQVLRRFVFGSVMCKLIPYFQAVSVSVAVWTLVAISLERYFAICRPLSSRRWQTQFHAYKMIGLVWTVSFLANSPLCYVQRLQPVGRTTGQMKCREVWPDRVWEKAYVLFHDVGLLFLPLLTMGFAYSMIVSKLWRGLRHEIKHSSLYQQTSKPGGQGPVGGCGAAVGSTCPGAGGAGVIVGGEQHSHPAAAGAGACTGGGLEAVGKPLKGKRFEAGFVLTSSLKKGPFKTSTAVVNFASNNNTIGKGNFNSGGGGGSNCGSNTTNGAGTSGNPCSSGVSNGSNAGSNGSGSTNGADRTLYCGGVGCEGRTGRLRGFCHFFAKFDETPTHQPHQHPYHHHCHHGHATTATGDDAKSDASYQFSRHAIRSTYMDKSIEAKKKVKYHSSPTHHSHSIYHVSSRCFHSMAASGNKSYARHAQHLQVIRMLFVIIVEFFVCWAPLHILNTVYLYSPSFVYQYVNSSGIALVQLMAYISSCCNPITYCFMNRRFRQAFLGIFNCYRSRMPICCCFCCTSKSGPMDGVESKAAAYLRQNTINQSGAERNNSDMSGNDSLVYVGRGLVQRSGKCPPPASTYPRFLRWFGGRACRSGSE